MFVFLKYDLIIAGFFNYKQNLPTNHDYVQCNFWHLHYVRKSELDSHHASCQHRLEKEAFKVTWECKLTFCLNFSLLDHF
jgi:hypothetical protein